MRRVIVLALVLSSCGGSHIDTGPVRPDPPDLPSGEPVRSIEIEGTTFTLYAQGDCVAVSAATPGLMTDVNRHCPGQDYPVQETPRCGWFEPERPDAGEWGCQAELPTVLYGKVTSPNVEWVCIATRPEDSLTTGVRFLDFDGRGYILEQQHPDETQYAHLFTFNGARYGESPLDAPSTDIYAACEAAAPWDGLGIHYDATLTITLDERLQQSGVVITADGGLGESGVSGTGSDDGVIDHYVRIGADSEGLAIRVLNPESTEVLAVLHPWPATLQRIVASDRKCVELLHLEMTIGAGALDGDPDEVSMSLRGEPCVSVLSQ